MSVFLIVACFSFTLNQIASSQCVSNTQILQETEHAGLFRDMKGLRQEELSLDVENGSFDINCLFRQNVQYDMRLHSREDIQGIKKISLEVSFFDSPVYSPLDIHGQYGEDLIRECAPIEIAEYNKSFYSRKRNTRLLLRKKHKMVKVVEVCLQGFDLSDDEAQCKGKMYQANYIELNLRAENGEDNLVAVLDQAGSISVKTNETDDPFHTACGPRVYLGAVTHSRSDYFPSNPIERVMVDVTETAFRMLIVFSDGDRVETVVSPRADGRVFVFVTPAKDSAFFARDHFAFISSIYQKHNFEVYSETDVVYSYGDEESFSGVLESEGLKDVKRVCFCRRCLSDLDNQSPCFCARVVAAYDDVVPFSLNAVILSLLFLFLLIIMLSAFAMYIAAAVFTYGEKTCQVHLLKNEKTAFGKVRVVWSYVQRMVRVNTRNPWKFTREYCGTMNCRLFFRVVLYTLKKWVQPISTSVVNVLFNFAEIFIIESMNLQTNYTLFMTVLVMNLISHAILTVCDLLLRTYPLCLYNEQLFVWEEGLLLEFRFCCKLCRASFQVFIHILAFFLKFAYIIIFMLLYYVFDSEHMKVILISMNCLEISLDELDVAISTLKKCIFCRTAKFGMFLEDEKRKQSKEHEMREMFLRDDIQREIIFCDENTVGCNK